MSGDDQHIEEDGVIVEDGVVDSGEDGDLSASLSAKEIERQRLQAEVEAFLNSGGKITCVDTDVMSDPPKRPETNYGGQPI